MQAFDGDERADLAEAPAADAEIQAEEAAAEEVEEDWQM